MTNVTSPPQLSRSMSAPVVTAIVHAATEEWQDAVVGGGQGDLVPLTVTFKTVLVAQTCTPSSVTVCPEKDQGGLEYQEKITLARHSQAIELDLLRDASDPSFWVQVTALETPEDTEAREASQVTEFCSHVHCYRHCGDERGQNKPASQRAQRTSRHITSNEFHMLAGWEALIRQISGSQKS